MNGKSYTISLLTSSSRRWLADIPYVFRNEDGTPSGCAPDALELYVFRTCDVADLRLAVPAPKEDDVPRGEVGLPEILDCCGDVSELATCIKSATTPTMPIVGIATYLPQLASADELRSVKGPATELGHREFAALDAMEAIMRFASAVGVRRVEMVGGRSDEECTRPPDRRGDNRYNCQVVVSYDDYAPDWLFDKSISGSVVTLREGYPLRKSTAPAMLKADWLAERLRTLYGRLYGGENILSPSVEVLLEIEPGELFVLSSFAAVNHILRSTEDLVFSAKGGRFVRFNADIGHIQLISGGRMRPAEVWKAMFDGVGKPSELIRNFHISSHPYLRVHLDHPPTTHPHYTLDDDPGPVTPYDPPTVPLELKKWLPCVICVAQNCDQTSDRINISLELEAASRDELAHVGIESIREAFKEIESGVCAVQGWQLSRPECQGCPELGGPAWQGPGHPVPLPPSTPPAI